MNKPFAITEDGGSLISGVETLRSQLIVSAVGVSLPADFGKKHQEKADLLERRLSRLESELGLSPLGGR